MDLNQTSLSQLRDIHMPGSISVWPIALAWYAVFILALAASFYAFYRYQLYRKKQMRKKNVLSHIDRLRHELCLEEHYPLVYQELSTLLRRIALFTHARPDVAHLTGEAWLSFLDQQCQTHLFTRDIGRLLLSAPYFPDNTPVADPKPLLTLTEEWVKRCV